MKSSSRFTKNISWVSLRKFGADLARFFVRRDNSLLSKAGVIMAVLYIISPIDFIPDIFPIIGWLDDTLVAFLTYVFVTYNANKQPTGKKNAPAPKDDVITVSARVIDDEQLSGNSPKSSNSLTHNELKPNQRS